MQTMTQEFNEQDLFKSGVSNYLGAGESNCLGEKTQHHLFTVILAFSCLILAARHLTALLLRQLSHICAEGGGG